MKRFFQRAYHFLERIAKEGKRFFSNRKNFGFSISKAIFWDGLFPPGKTESYIQQVERYIETNMSQFVRKYKVDTSWRNHKKYADFDKIPVWVCWWQGEESMPELVHMCYDRLRERLPKEAMELHMITFDNYREYVTFPEHIERKYQEKKITMTNLSDMLRMSLLSKYGGFWVDATVFLTGEFPKEFLNQPFYSQKMYDPVKCQREACKGRWCGFFMTGYSHNPLFTFVRDAFFEWWKKYDDIVDYVLIDYLILLGYNNIPEIRELVDAVSDNNVDIFEMYQVLNQPYSEELYKRLTERNVIHKLTYKMDLQKTTSDGQDTLYGYLLKDVKRYEC